MTLTVRQSSVTGATTAGRALTYAEMDANWAHVIDSSNQSFVQSGSGAIAGTVQAELRRTFSPEQFGAAADGTTDDSAAIIAALAAGPTRLTPGKTYFCGSNITMNVAGMVLYGDGTLKGNGSATASSAVIKITANNCIVRDITINQNDISSGKSIWVSGADNTLIERVKNSNGQSSFIHGDGVLTNLTVRGCSNVSRGYGVLINEPSAGSKNIIIQHNYFVNSEAAGIGDGIEINAPTNGCSNVIISNNFIGGMTGDTSSAGIGIGLANVTGATITGNMIFDCESDAIHVENSSTGIVISGNRIKNCLTASTNVSGAISILSGCTDVTISGNVVKDTANKHGIATTASNGTFNTVISITGNVIDGASLYLISLDSVKDVVVSGNVLENANTSNTATTSSIRVTKLGTNVSDAVDITNNKIRSGSNATRSVILGVSAVTGCRIVGNNFKDCTTPAPDQGSGNTVEVHGNVYGSNAMSGTFTFSTTTTKTVSNNNVEAAAYIAVWPSNAAAVTLGTLFISTVTKQTSFVVTAASAGAGTETYNYAIL